MSHMVYLGKIAYYPRVAGSDNYQRASLVVRGSFSLQSPTVVNIRDLEWFISCV